MASPGRSPENIAHVPSDEDKAHLILQFQEIVGIENEVESESKLEQHNWNLEAAIQTSFNEREGLPSVYDNKYGSSNEPDQVKKTVLYSSAGNAVDVSRRSGWRNWLRHAAFLPIALIKISYHFGYSIFSEFFNFVYSLLSPNYLQVTQGPLDDILHFKKTYDSINGTQHPIFYLGSYQQALTDAKKELKFLLIYLHASDHQDTPEFCRTVLSNEGFIEYVNGNMIFWACDISSNEGLRVSRAMRETSYPFLGLVCLRENRMVIVWKSEGLMNVDQILAEFVQVVDENEPFLVAARAERQELSISQNIRNEQDAAYQNSLAIDQQKAEERQKLMDAKKEIEHKQQQKKIKKEEKLQAIIKKRAEFCQTLKNSIEPSPSDKDALMIRVKLPSGRQVQRYFLKTTTYQFLYNFVLASDDTLTEFVLSTNFPRTTYELKPNEFKTLKELGIVTSTPMFVESSLEDSSDDDS